MRTHHRFDVALTLLGPILTRGGRAAPAGIDAAVARTAAGLPMLPYSLVKGRVMDAVRQTRSEYQRYEVNGKPKFRFTDRLAYWFGNPSSDGAWDPDRGRVRFSDFVADERGDDNGVIERVQIDPNTGTAAGRMLAMMEAPFGYGQPVTFRGRVEFVGTPAEADELDQILNGAFRAVPAFGALKTVGYGRTHAVEVRRAGSAKTMVGMPASGPLLPVRWIPDRPLCLVGPKHSRNHFESLENIPGAVLKGATARLLLEACGAAGTEVTPEATSALFPLLGRHFALIRFGEARPLAPGAGRPVVPPLSVVVSGAKEDKGKWFDVAQEPGPRLVRSTAPKFASDWKSDEEGMVRKAFGWPDVRRVRRTRTAVDADTGRAADEELFSYGLVLPDELAWDGVIGLHDIPTADQRAVAAELAQLYAWGLPNIGKTRAIATVTWLTEPTPLAVARQSPTAGEPHIVILQTDFLMTDPDLLSAGKPLRDAYAAFWAEASGGAFQLERFFARQSLHGGYLAKRFGTGRFAADRYEPFLVTDRGSVFILAPTGSGDVAAALTDWITRGLPLPIWAEKRYAANGPLWKTCPFMPHAGFGEVVIDLACHTSPPHRIPEADG